MHRIMFSEVLIIMPMAVGFTLDLHLAYTVFVSLVKQNCARRDA